jgi:hypothetical protein
MVPTGLLVLQKWTKPGLAEYLGCSYTNIENRLKAEGFKLKRTRTKIRGGRGAPPQVYLVVPR